MTTYSFCDAETGVFVGKFFAGPTEDLPANTPAGCAAVCGDHDWTRYRLDPETGNVVPWVPPAPADDAHTRWAWDAEVWRWQPVLTLLGLKAQRWGEIKALRDAEIDEPLVTELGTFDHDPKSRQAILEMANGAALSNLDVVVTKADNNAVKLTPREAATLLMLSHMRVQNTRLIATELRADLEQADSAAAVAAVTWPKRAG